MSVGGEMIAERLVAEPGFEVVHIDAGDPNLEGAAARHRRQPLTGCSSRADPADKYAPTVERVAGHGASTSSICRWKTFHPARKADGDVEPQNRIDAESTSLRAATSSPRTPWSSCTNSRAMALIRPHRDRAAWRRPRLLLARFPPRCSSALGPAMSLLFFVSRISVAGVDVAVEAQSRCVIPPAC